MKVPTLPSLGKTRFWHCSKTSFYSIVTISMVDSEHVSLNLLIPMVHLIVVSSVIQVWGSKIEEGIMGYPSLIVPFPW